MVKPRVFLRLEYEKGPETCRVALLQETLLHETLPTLTHGILLMEGIPIRP